MASITEWGIHDINNMTMLKLESKSQTKVANTKYAKKELLHGNAKQLDCC